LKIVSGIRCNARSHADRLAHLTARDVGADTSGALTLPVLIVVGDEDDACIEPSLFLKQNIPASGLAVFPRPATSSISRSRRCSTKRWSASWPWRKRIAGRRAILPRGVPEDGLTASVRRVGSIRAVEGRGTMTSPLDAFAEAAACKSWVSGRASCRLQRALPASRAAQISEKALF
jgi:hypothetical protein